MPTPLEISFTASALPGGWRGSPQAFFNEIVSRLSGTVDGDNFITGKIGGTEPTSDVGPWLNGNVWYFWSTTNARYERQSSTQAYIKLSDVKAANTGGGTFNSGAWQTRDINTIDNDVEGLASVAANQITLQPGAYEAVIVCPAFKVGTHQARLQNITTPGTTLLGVTSNATDATAAAGGSNSIIMGAFSIDVATTFEIQHRCQSSAATEGFGRAGNFGSSEIYTIATFRGVPT